MGITNSLGAYAAPGYNANHLTPRTGDFVQTAGSLAGTTTINVIAKETSADAFFMTFLSVIQTDPTANAVTTIYVATGTALGQFATGAIGTLNFAPGPMGIMCGNTDTYSVYVKSTFTTTVYFVCTGYRLV